MLHNKRLALQISSCSVNCPAETSDVKKILLSAKPKCKGSLDTCRYCGNSCTANTPDVQMIVHVIFLLVYFHGMSLWYGLHSNATKHAAIIALCSHTQMGMQKVCSR